MPHHDSRSRPPNSFYELGGPTRLDETRELQLQALSVKPHSVSSAHLLGQLNVLLKERAESIVLKHYRYGNYHQLTLPKDKIGSTEGAIRAAITATLLPHWGKSAPSAGFDQDRRRRDIRSCSKLPDEFLRAYMDRFGDKTNEGTHCVVQGPILLDGDGCHPQLQPGAPTVLFMASLHEINKIVEDAVIGDEKLVITRPLHATSARRLGLIMARHAHAATDQYYLISGAEQPAPGFFGLAAGPECKFTVKKIFDFINAGCEKIPGIEQVYHALAMPTLDPTPVPFTDQTQEDVVKIYETFIISRPILSVTQRWRDEARQCTRAIHRLKIDYTPYRDRLKFLSTIWCHSGVISALEHALGLMTVIGKLTDTDPRKLLAHEIASRSDEWPLEQTALLWSLSRRFDEEIDLGTRKILRRLATNATTVKSPAPPGDYQAHHDKFADFAPQPMTIIPGVIHPGPGPLPRAAKPPKPSRYHVGTDGNTWGGSVD